MKWWFHKQIEDLLINLKIRKYKKDKFFKIADEVSTGLLPIEILEGSYKGTIFTVNEIKVIDDYGKTRFDFDIVKKIPGVHDSYYGPHFSKMVGEILLVCVAEAVDNYSKVRKEVLNDEKDRSDYFEQPVEERTISTKGDSPSKA